MIYVQIVKEIMKIKEDKRKKMMIKRIDGCF
jgi:hypothetical protein